jgi:CspA family cold shock protein
MPVGRVKWYDKSKGYGFIESPQGDVFFHFSDIQMEGFKALAEDQRVSYEMFRSEQGLKAKNIRPLDNRASVRHAARYRNLIHMRIKEGCIEQFDEMMMNIPGWFDAMEQDLGLRRIGTWRSGLNAVRLVESDRPYEQSMQAASSLDCWENYQQWREQLRELIEGDEEMMSPVQDQPKDEVPEEPAEEQAESPSDA